MLAPNSILILRKLIDAPQLGLAVLGRVADVVDLYLDNRNGPVAGTASKSVGVFNESNASNRAAFAVAPCLSRSMQKVLFESLCVPDLDRAIVRGCNEKGMIRRRKNAYDGASMLSECGNVDALRSPWCILVPAISSSQGITADWYDHRAKVVLIHWVVLGGYIVQDF